MGPSGSFQDGTSGAISVIIIKSISTIDVMAYFLTMEISPEEFDARDELPATLAVGKGPDAVGWTSGC